MGPALTVEGATTSAVFETYVEQVLEPTLRKGQVVVMDNLSAHKGERVKELIEGRGCELIYLPSYSPDFNPIEEAFSKIKDFLRKARRGLGRRSWRPSAQRSRRSPLRTRAASSSTVGTLCRFNHYGERCRGWHIVLACAGRLSLLRGIGGRCRSESSGSYLIAQTAGRDARLCTEAP
jgi:transposase